MVGLSSLTRSQPDDGLPVAPPQFHAGIRRGGLHSEADPYWCPNSGPKQVRLDCTLCFAPLTRLLQPPLQIEVPLELYGLFAAYLSLAPPQIAVDTPTVNPVSLDGHLVAFPPRDSMEDEEQNENVQAERVRIYVSLWTLTDDEQGRKKCPGCTKERQLIPKGPKGDFAYICRKCYSGRTSLCAIAAHYTDETALDLLEECPGTGKDAEARSKYLENRCRRFEAEEKVEKVRVYRTV
jgi:hypothetical protein